MNKILQLFDENFVADLFRREVLPHYSAFTALSRVEIKPYKKLIWETTYHVVIRFNTYFLKATGEEVKIPIVCSAHSDESRDNIYLALKALWAADFPNEFIDLPDPLFYSPEFRGTFYRGLRGENLLYYIKNKDVAAVAEIVTAAAKLFARLHTLTNLAAVNLNHANARIKTVIPGTTMIFKEMGARYHNQYNNDLMKIYDYFTEQEEKYFSAGAPLVLIHGDAHPENIIRTAPNRLGLIDFTDLCLGDRARDLGAFLQQLEYKIVTKTEGQDWAAKMKNLFLSVYLDAANLKLTTDLQTRIDLYYNWTAVRTATYFFLKAGHNEERGIALLKEVKANLKL
ncbi:MAG: phosphotransferase [Patescibacteria group bacterium]